MAASLVGMCLLETLHICKQALQICLLVGQSVEHMWLHCYSLLIWYLVWTVSNFLHHWRNVYIMNTSIVDCISSCNLFIDKFISCFLPWRAFKEARFPWILFWLKFSWRYSFFIDWNLFPLLGTWNDNEILSVLCRRQADYLWQKTP